MDRSALCETEIYRRIVQWEIDHPDEPVPIEMARELREVERAMGLDRPERSQEIERDGR